MNGSASNIQKYPETSLKELMDMMKKSEVRKEDAKVKEKEFLYKRFLNDYTPLKMENELNEYVIGQPELVKAVAGFLYYHVLRKVYPQLPVRNLLVAGSSGSGKTEVFRRAQELYGDVIKIKIADGSRITKEGWSGSHKLEGILSPDLDVLVVDEADKLCTPAYATGGSNVSKEIQTEFLKLMEGEYEVMEKRKLLFVIKGLSLAFAGAFETIREQKREEIELKQIGFGVVEKKDKKGNHEITDEDFIKFGVLPELLGRISIKVVTNDLTDTDYLQILKNPHGRVSTLLEVLSVCGMQIDQVLTDEEILAMIKKSRGNRTGFRWVSAQVENKILEAIREGGIVVTLEEEKSAGVNEVEDDDSVLWTPGDNLFDE